MSEARPLFLQLAEIHLKHNRQAEAVALLKKLLQAEPDNLRIQIRLADLYQAMGQKGEAVDTYVSAAQRALARGDHAESEKQADKALKLDPTNASGLTVKARSASSQGKFAEAAEFLEGLARPRKRRRTERIPAGPVSEDSQLGRRLLHWRCRFLRATRKISAWRRK